VAGSHDARMAAAIKTIDRLVLAGDGTRRRTAG